MLTIISNIKKNKKVLYAIIIVTTLLLLPYLINTGEYIFTLGSRIGTIIRKIYEGKVC